MPISLKLPSLDDNPILLAETRSHKINEFIQKLPFGDPITAATDLIDELQILNSQKVATALTH
jgi:cyclic-di-GMP-binding protein